MAESPTGQNTMVEPQVPNDLPPQLSATTLRRFPIAMVLADPTLPDCPIIYVNEAFTRMTGYTQDAAVGRNCRFRQGPHTREEDRETLRRAIEAGEEVTLDILNYRSDGIPFVNRLLVAPLPDDDDPDKVRYFVGVQTVREGDTSYADRAANLDEQLSELQHRVKNHLSMILAMIRLEAAAADSAEAFAEVVSRRVESLSVLYDEFAGRDRDGEDETVALGAYLGRVATAVHAVSGRPGVRLNTGAEAMTCDLDRAARLGLYLSEVLSNSFQHAFAGEERGEIRLTLERGEAGRACLVVEDDGHGVGDDAWPRQDSLGGRIVVQLVERMGGELRVEPASDDAERPGTRVRLCFPDEARD